MPELPDLCVFSQNLKKEILNKKIVSVKIGNPYKINDPTIINEKLAGTCFQDIIREGKELKHCVGGYAARHADGKLVILFLRDKRHPARPLMTIEMQGKTIRQIHGFRNDANAKQSPREKYAEILDPWLSWIESGSKRDKKGKPVEKKIAEAKTA